MKIYDQDIQTWTATIEEHEAQLRRCPVILEPMHAKKRDAARLVLKALQNYKTTVESFVR